MSMFAMEVDRQPPVAPFHPPPQLQQPVMEQRKIGNWKFKVDIYIYTYKIDLKNLDLDFKNESDDMTYDD